MSMGSDLIRFGEGGSALPAVHCAEPRHIDSIVALQAFGEGPAAGLGGTAGALNTLQLLQASPFYRPRTEPCEVCVCVCARVFKGWAWQAGNTHTRVVVDGANE